MSSYPVTEVGGTWPGKLFAAPPTTIIIHSMSEYLEGLHAPIWLRDKAKLSAHCFVSPEGGRHLGQSPDKEAWHAGTSSFQGTKGLNKTSLGIEVLLKGSLTNNAFRSAIHKKGAFTDEQYYATALQCNSWIAKIPTIKPDNIRGHNEVSSAQFREDFKVDPGQGWNWYLFFKFLYETH